MKKGSRIEIGPSKEERAASLDGIRHFTHVRPSPLHCFTSIHKKKKKNININERNKHPRKITMSKRKLH